MTIFQVILVLMSYLCYFFDQEVMNKKLHFEGKAFVDYQDEYEYGNDNA